MNDNNPYLKKHEEFNSKDEAFDFYAKEHDIDGENWQKERAATEAKYKKKLVERLRAAADAIEKGGFPDVMCCSFENVDGKFCSGWTIESVSVTMSHLWGG
jgi:hypothetical protein